MDNLNYHHLRYFREVAHEGNLTRAAERMNLSQSALSAQISTLEERLGHPLFKRVSRQLVLTEVGQIVLDYADRIFSTGQELIATLERSSQQLPPLRVGALSTLSRNFQLNFLKPVFEVQDLDLILKSGSARVLYAALKSLALDVVLTTEPPGHEHGNEFTAHRISEQSVGIHGVPERINPHKSLKSLLSSQPLIVPTESAVNIAFRSLATRLGITPRIVADVDDMAMVRLLARQGIGLAIAPAVVMADELRNGRLVSAPFDLKIVEDFYAVTVERSFPHPVLETLIHMEG